MNTKYNRKIVEIVPKYSSYGNDVKNIIRFAVNECKKYDSDEIFQTWCVFDRDKNTENNLKEALLTAYKNKIRVAVSNPCFEVWILMHYESSSSYIENGEVAKNLVKNKISNFDSSKGFFQKNQQIFEEFFSSFDEAVLNSEKVDKEHDKDFPEKYEKQIFLVEYNFKRNRSTHIYKLMTQIKELIDNKQR